MNPIISIRISHQRGVDAVLTDSSCEVIDEFSKDCYAPGVFTPFISNHVRDIGKLAVVIAPGDPWPPHLQRAVEDIGVPIHWVSPTFYQDARHAAAPWRRKRRQYRARFLAHLYYAQQGLCEYGFEAGTEWERTLAQQTLDAIDAEMRRMYDF